ncbi:MAG TPA: hypothetical protein VHC22_15790 [Pirellulales bacterium]|nr:hypothetical protein [Pirellulales bacterium]
MRLTLRTMLAFVDDILEAADARDVGKKISESEFATGLMHRMRDVTRRLRLGAPKLYGRGMGHDPNTVAEYLDNTLLSQRVADFEKVCLESDVHLAEVASCHQILALVLGEPAEIETNSRHRMYELIQQAESTSHRTATAKDGQTERDGAARAARKKKKRRKVKVPDYLREPAEVESKSRPWGMVLAALILLAAGGGLVFYWPTISERFLVARGGAPDDQGAPAANGNDKPRNNADDRNTSSSNTGGGNTGGGNSGGSDTGGSDTGGSNAASDDTEGGNSRPDNATDTTDDRRRTANERASEEGAGNAAGTTNERAEDRSAQTPERSTASDMDSGTAANVDDEPAGNGGNRKTGAGKTGSTKTSRATEPEPTDDESARPSSEGANRSVQKERAEPARTGEGVGRLISEHDVLLRSIDDQWQRVPGRGTVHSGARLIALPTYRPSIAMSNGVTLQLLGGAIVSLGATDDDGVAEIRLLSGRILLLTVAKPDTTIRLQAGDYQGTIEFGKQEAALAVEVRHLLPEGADPEQEPAPTSVDLYLASGDVTWTDQKGRSDRLSGRLHRSLGRKGANQPGEDLPVWMEASELNPTERRASVEVESFLRPDKGVGSALTELATHRKIENSLLAVQSLALIDEFEPIVPLLNDSKYRINWTPQIDCLRAALARSPQTAELVRQAFESSRTRELGGQLYRMLWGYNSQQLEEGAAAQLVEWLDAPDERLDFRVLSYWNLHHITGLGLYYQPADPEKQRRKSIQSWRQKLESGLIVPKST